MKKRLKIFHIVSNPGIGGIEAMLSEIIPRMDKDRFDMGIINLYHDLETRQLWQSKGITCYELPKPGKLLLGSVIRLAKLLRKEKAEIVEIYGLRANIIGRLAAVLAAVPVILTGVRSTDDWRKWYHVWLDRATSWAVKGWIPNAQACKNSLIEREKFPAKRIDVIYTGIDTAYWTQSTDASQRAVLRESWGCNEDNIVFVTVANLRKDKGVQFLTEAIPTVLQQRSNARFVLVGIDLMGGKLQDRCKQLGIGYAVTFTGFRTDIRDIYQAADVAVLPSLREGMPICLIEAMSMELPVVASAVSGTPELVDNGNTGILVPPKDVEALAKALIEVASDAEKRRQMGRAGRQRVSRMFTIERMAQEHIDYYKKQFYSIRKNGL